MNTAQLRKYGSVGRWRDMPWRQMATRVRQRFVEVRLGQAAGSLTFTTTIALVPLLTVGLAIFTVFPQFADIQALVQRWLIDSLMPEGISRQVLSYVTQFTTKASRLGLAGMAIWSFAFSWRFPDALPNGLTLSNWTAQLPALRGPLLNTVTVGISTVVIALLLAVGVLEQEARRLERCWGIEFVRLFERLEFPLRRSQL